MKKLITLMTLILAVFSDNIFSQDLTNGIVSYWKLDEASGSVADGAGNNSGTVNGATSTSSGKISNAYIFSGDDGITIGNQSVYSFGTTSDFSLSAWVKTSSTNDQFIISKYESGIEPGIILGTYNGAAYACIRDGVGSNSYEYVNADGTSIINNNQWHLITATFDRDGNLTLYVDGNPEISLSIATITETINNSMDLCIGYRTYESSPKYFTGTIDEVGIWNRALSAGEVTSLYNGGVGLSYPSPTTYTLTSSTSPTAGGTVNLSPAGGSYASGTTVTATAIANSGFTFTGWSGALTGTTNPGTVIMNANKTLTATFTSTPTFSLTITTPTNGTITASPAGPNYASGTAVTLTATPSSSYQFVSWGGSASGTTSPTTLTMNSNKTVSATFSVIPTGADNLGNHTATQNIKLGTYWLSGDGGNEGIRVAANGNVGIGTVTPSQPLTVNGKILAKEVEVVSSIASDYVFEPAYQLMPLTELEIYLKQHKHLPGIPSALEFKKQGQNLGEMQDMLLRKIEELTLHLIQQENKIQELQNEVDELKSSKKK